MFFYLLHEQNFDREKMWTIILTVDNIDKDIRQGHANTIEIGKNHMESSVSGYG